MLLTGECPLVVERPVMIHHWEQLTFLHWAYESTAVQRLLPAGLTVETYDGRAWVGLVPFWMRVSPPGIGAPPWLGRFCETNVRTYVHDKAGRSGVWFFSLDASRLAAVVAARTTYRLPYFWSHMSLHRDEETLAYTCRRRWPGPKSARCDATMTVGPAFERDALTELDHFLTARWRLFSVSGRGRIRYADAQHDPWPLRRVEVDSLDQDLVQAIGLPAPAGDPLAHFAEGVTVRIGRPHLAG